jgi:hypothetical protein
MPSKSDKRVHAVVLNPTDAQNIDLLKVSKEADNFAGPRLCAEPSIEDEGHLVFSSMHVDWRPKALG